MACSSINGVYQGSVKNRKTKAYNLCREYLGGSWKTVSFEKFHFEALTGGLSNELYICSVPDDHAIHEGPRKVLLRIYGRLHGQLVNDVHALVSDVVIFALLAERNVGPKLYAIFPEGRLEEHVSARNLANEELKKPNNSVKIARKLKEYHNMSLPLCKEPNWLWEYIHRLLQDINDLVLGNDEKSNIIREMCKKHDFHKETIKLRTYIESESSVIVFCHNDVQEGNILAIPQGTSSDGQEQYEFKFIDFEYSAFNYRGFDIANHFCEWMFDYTVKEAPLFSAKFGDFPTKEEQLLFIRAYLGKDINCHSCDRISDDEQELLREVERFTLISHFFWGLWAIVQSKLSSINFGFLEYARVRLEGYEGQKKDLGWE